MTDDTTVRVSFRIQKSLAEQVKECKKKHKHLTDSEAYRQLLVAGLRSMEEYDKRTDKDGTERKGKSG